MEKFRQHQEQGRKPNGILLKVEFAVLAGLIALPALVSLFNWIANL